MKVFGSISRLVSILFRKDSQDITLEPNQATTYTASRILELPPGDTAHVIVSATSTQTLSNKTISGASNTISNVSLTAGVTGILPTANGGTGQNSTATFPTSGVVVTEAGTETLTNKTISGSSNTLTVLAASQLSGVTPVANGGTNSSTSLSNNRVMKSSGGAIVEAAAITAARALISDANGIPTQSTTTDTELGYVSGVTSAIQTQLDGKQPLDSDLTAVAALTTTGLIVRTGTGTATTRTLVAGTNISLTNANGVAGDITINATSSVSSFKANWVTGDGTTKTITHNLGSSDVIVQLYDKATNQTIEVDTVTRTDANTLDLSASEAPNASGWRVMILAV